MISLRVTEVVTSLSTEELDRLHDFLLSPYHNSGYNSKRIVSLFEKIREALDANRIGELSKEELNREFYPEHTFVAKKKNPIDALSSDLFGKFKDFLFYEAISGPDYDVHRVLALAVFYRVNSYEDRFWQLIKQFRKTHAKKGLRNANYYLDAFLIEAEVSSFLSIFNTYTDDANLLVSHRYLDQFYATQKLECAAILAFQEQLGENIDSQEKRTTPLLTDNFSEYSSFQTPLARYHKTILEWLNQPPSAAQLEAFFQALKGDEQEIATNKFRNLMAFYRFFLNRQYRNEATGLELLRKVFSVFRDHLEQGYFLVDDKLMPISLKAIISLATKLGEIAWAKSILQQYPPTRITGTRYPEETHSLCDAEVLFANQEFAAAQDKLNYRNFENVNYSILADVLLIKIYYMQNDDLIENRIPALEKKVRRSKLAQRDKTAYINFLRFLLRVLKYEHDKHSKKWQKLKTDLQNTVPMLQREWLQSIISE